MAVFAQFAREESRIERRFAADIPSGTLWDGTCADSHPYSREYAVIRLYDAWAGFCRELVLSSAGLSPQTRLGLAVPTAPGVKGRSAALTALLGTYPAQSPSRTWGPRWANASECIQAAQRLGVANLATISGAIGSTPSPAEDLRIVRNFAAHRGSLTAARAAPVAATVGVLRFHGVDHLMRQLVSPGVTLLTMWSAQLRQIGFAAIA